MSNVIIRPFTQGDQEAIIQLFKDAVHAINSRDYTPEQCAVWTDIDVTRFSKRLHDNISYVAVKDDQIVGFADITHDGYLDRLYIHKDYQGQFISYYLMKKLEEEARERGLQKLTTDCSITARKPAERFGFHVIKEQQVERQGILLTNYYMEKKL